ncbi:MAG: hypothetical protein CMQ34_11610 [Gammaproteobacteria bacterium]|nr:hypothetical protein [Gammaproteobacteria bacterium]|tara:strand:- start:941 stop:1177 length:237 start_codon:yes stop_codon:yes gene_type:complete
MLFVKSAKYLRDYKIWVSFDDGSAGEVDLDGLLKGPVFDPLKDPHYFRQFTVDPELETVVWPNGADLAPEFLKAHLRN